MLISFHIVSFDHSFGALLVRLQSINESVPVVVKSSLIDQRGVDPLVTVACLLEFLHHDLINIGGTLMVVNMVFIVVADENQLRKRSIRL